MKNKHFRKHFDPITPLKLVYGLALRQKAVEVGVEQFVNNVPGADVNQLREALIESYNAGVKSVPVLHPAMG